MLGLPQRFSNNLPGNAGEAGSVLGWEDTLEEAMATYSIFLAEASHGQRSMAG